MKPLELGEIVEGAARNVVDQGLRRSAVGKDDLVGLGLDVKDPVFLGRTPKTEPRLSSFVSKLCCPA